MKADAATSAPPQRLPAAQLKRFIADSLLAVGLPAKDAATCAELMVRADLHGADGHGIFRLPQYVRRIKGGAVNVKPKVRSEERRVGKEGRAGGAAVQGTDSEGSR